MNGWSAYCLWRGAAAAEAGEATESRPDRQCALHSGGQPSGRSYRRGEKQKAASDLSDSPSSAGSESCVFRALLFVFSSLQVCSAARRSRTQPTHHTFPAEPTSVAPGMTWQSFQ
ncbi:uncharacterized protein VSU04_005664 isoform 1-T1 [Chlamydotis macqueenii]